MEKEKMAKPWSGKVPYDERGLLAYGRAFTGAVLPDKYWRDNSVWLGTMTIMSFGRGRSSATFILTDNRGLRYDMFMKDMLYLIQNADIDRGVVTGKWTVVKRGQNYGLAYQGKE